MNTELSSYLTRGCLRCTFGDSPRCKVHAWKTELMHLQNLISDFPLIPVMKWGVPVYTLEGKNVLTLYALKDSAVLSFFKGALFNDPSQLLLIQGNVQAARILKFKAVHEIEQNEDAIRYFVNQSIEVERKGLKVVLAKNPEPIPEELEQAFDADPTFKAAFFSLTPGRQRGYNIYISQARQKATRLDRIAKNKDRIFRGLGMQDKG
jgi:uncharacterized protein YdeI (YjbR/CyaY-like superfamily)